MTKLQPGNGTRRETAITMQGRALIVEMRPRTLVLRLKGRHYQYEIGWETIWNRAAEIEVRRRSAERAIRQMIKRSMRSGGRKA